MGGWRRTGIEPDTHPLRRVPTLADYNPLRNATAPGLLRTGGAMTTGSVSPRRADTRRNHERILAVAADSLAVSGEVSFNAIAKKAEIGVGTVYRHFPTPEALILAVYQREVRQIVDVVPSLLEQHSPERAFRIWTTDHLAHYMMTKRGLANALRMA